MKMLASIMDETFSFNFPRGMHLCLMGFNAVFLLIMCCKSCHISRTMISLCCSSHLSFASCGPWGAFMHPFCTEKSLSLQMLIDRTSVEKRKHKIAVVHSVSYVSKE
ncbi:hypothetical protein NE237_003802 [Protea cynaroides]|uniref:Uncharacterized protein n=1 Tax=Protea cynaroides TaxID=273540 RepID=A0A9Q0KHH6_9MAGN|nr:hypothetical protein NE237_003802 [Protea cynaroides]